MEASFIQVSKDLVNQYTIGSKSNVYTGLESLDNYIQGFQQGELILLADRPLVGKDAFINTLLINIGIKQKKKCLYTTNECSTETAKQRLLSGLSEIEDYKISKNKLSQTETDTLDSISKHSVFENIFITARKRFKLENVLEISRLLKTQNQLDFVIVDFYDFLGNFENANLSSLIKDCKKLAVELNIPILLAYKLNASVENGINWNLPHLALLNENENKILENVDLVLFLYRYDYYGFSEDENGNPTFGTIHILATKRYSETFQNLKFSYKKHCFKIEDFEVQNQGIET